MCSAGPEALAEKPECPGAAALPRLSVVLSCRNGSALLPAMLDSLAAQRYPERWEVVLVDNGSTDDTAAVMRSFSDRLPHCVVLSNPAPGYQASGINLGVAYATGDVLLLLDGDDVVAADYVLFMGRALAAAPFVGGRIDCRRLNDNGERSETALAGGDGISPMFRYLPVVVGAAMGVRRDVFLEIGGLDEEQPSQPDVDLSWRLHRAGYVATFVPDAVLHYRFKDTPRDVMRQEMVYGVGEALLYRNHRGFGMPGRGPLTTVVGWARTAIALITVWQSGGRERLAASVGKNLGRLRGSLRYGCWYL